MDLDFGTALKQLSVIVGALIRGVVNAVRYRGVSILVISSSFDRSPAIRDATLFA